MTSVFVVTYQFYHWGDYYEDVKYVMNDNVKVKGVFSTMDKAENFIKQYIKENWDMYFDYEPTEKDLEELDIDRDWSIFRFELDKYDTTPK